MTPDERRQWILQAAERVDDAVSRLRAENRRQERVIAALEARLARLRCPECRQAGRHKMSCETGAR